MWFFFQISIRKPEGNKWQFSMWGFLSFFLNVILNSKDLLFIIKILIYCPIKANLLMVCWLKSLETESLFKNVCLFLLFLDFYLFFGKNKLFLDISGNENKAYRYFKKQRDFILYSRIKTTDVLLWNTWYHCAFDWHLSLLLHLYTLLQKENPKLFQGIIAAM